MFRTINDALKILDRAKENSKCICIGGGLLGLETAGALQKKGVNVTVLEGFKWLLPRQLPETAGKMLKEKLESNGINVLLNARTKEIVGDEAAQGVVLEDGRTLDADIVVVSTGVRSSSYLARRSNLNVKNGIVVDDRMFTSDTSILAAGDVAEHRGVVYGIWPASYMEGVVAGINAAGGDAEFQGIPRSNQLKVLNFDLFSIGQLDVPDGSYNLIEVKEGGAYRCIVIHDNQIIGAALLGDMSLSTEIKTAIERGTHIQELNILMEQFPNNE